MATIQTHSTQGTPSSLLTHGGTGFGSIIQHDKPTAGFSFGNLYEFGFEDGTIGQFSINPGAPATYVITNTDSVLGSRCFDVTYPANQSDEGVGLTYSGANLHGQTFNDLWVRFALKQVQGVPVNFKKILRFYSGIGDIIVDPSNGYFAWYFESFSGTHGNIPMTNGPQFSSIIGQWHWLEAHVALNFNIAPAHVDVYWDNTLIFSLDASAAAGYSGTNTIISSWDHLEFDGTQNAGANPLTETRIDQIGISTTKMGIPTVSSNP